MPGGLFLPKYPEYFFSAKRGALELTDAPKTAKCGLEARRGVPRITCFVRQSPKKSRPEVSTANSKPD